MTRTHRASFLPPSSAGIPDRYLTALVLFDELAVRVRSSVEGLSSADRLGGGDRSGQYRLDLVADADVVDSLLASGYNVLSEESGFHDQGASLTVVVDPVDGSTNASRGLPWWASSFSLVAEVDGALTPVASLVAMPSPWSRQVPATRIANRSLTGRSTAASMFGSAYSAP